MTTLYQSESRTITAHAGGSHGPRAASPHPQHGVPRTAARHPEDVLASDVIRALRDDGKLDPANDPKLTGEQARAAFAVPALLAIARCASGVMILSWVPTIAQAGIDFQAGGPDGSATAASDAGRCVAWMSAASSGETSLAKLSATTCGSR